MIKKIKKITIISGLALYAGFAFAAPSPAVNILPVSEIEKETKVIEKETKFCTKEYMPVCADTGKRCIKAPCNSEVTLGNLCEAEVLGLKVLHKGACEESQKENNDKVVFVKKTMEPKKKEESLEGKFENPEIVRIIEEKELLIQKLSVAKNESERKKVLKDWENMKLAASSEIIPAPEENQELLGENKILEKREEILEKKSNEIFTKFDFFILKINTVAKKIELKNKTVQSNEVTEILNQVQITLKEANVLKSEAWIMFSEIAGAETKVVAGEKISVVKKLLTESKEKISVSFVSVKQALNFLKNS